MEAPTIKFQEQDKTSRLHPDFVGLPELAERLGVKPNEGGGAMWIRMKDGRQYDVFALVNAFLDRLDKTLPVK